MAGSSVACAAAGGVLAGSTMAGGAGAGAGTDCGGPCDCPATAEATTSIRVAAQTVTYRDILRSVIGHQAFASIVRIHSPPTVKGRRDQRNQVREEGRKSA